MLPLKLEYFRRYQLDVRQRYYRGRGTQHKAAAWHNNRWLTASMMFTTTSIAVGTLVALHMAAAWDLSIPSWILEWTAGVAGPEVNVSYWGSVPWRPLCMDLGWREASWTWMSATFRAS